MGELVTSTNNATGTVVDAPTTNTAPAAPSTFADLLKAAGADADVIASPTLTKFTNIAGLAKSYVELEKHMGQKGVPLPARTVDEDPSAWSSVWQQLGRPDAPDKYVYPDGADGVNAGLLQMLREVSFAEGMTQRQSAKLFEAYQAWARGEVAKSEEADKTLRTKAIAELRGEWGNAFDERLTAAKALVNEFGGPELMKLYDAIGLNDHPAHLKLLATAAQFLRGERLVGKAVGLTGVMSPAEAQAALRAMEADKYVQQVLFQPDDPKHAEVKARRMELYKQAYPS